MNVLATDNESYLKTCRYSQEHPYCPIFVLGNIVRWAGGNFQEMASEVGVPLRLMCVPSWLYCSLGGCEESLPRELPPVQAALQRCQCLKSSWSHLSCPQGMGVL